MPLTKIRNMRTMELMTTVNFGCVVRTKVHIVSRKALAAASQKHSDAETGLDAWFKVARTAEWKNLEDVRKTYPHADGVVVGDRTYTVFNVGGNRFRLIVKIEYKYQKIFIKHVLTHAEYDKEEWKK